MSTAIGPIYRIKVQIRQCRAEYRDSKIRQVILNNLDHDNKISLVKVNCLHQLRANEDLPRCGQLSSAQIC